MAWAGDRRRLKYLLLLLLLGGHGGVGPAVDPACVALEFRGPDMHRATMTIIAGRVPSPAAAALGKRAPSPHSGSAVSHLVT
jgi:hypothetical protein